MAMSPVVRMDQTLSSGSDASDRMEGSGDTAGNSQCIFMSPVTEFADFVVNTKGVEYSKAKVRSLMRTRRERPVVLSCFDRSGSGKTTAIRNAALANEYMHLLIDAAEHHVLLAARDECMADLKAMFKLTDRRIKGIWTSEFRAIFAKYVPAILSQCLAVAVSQGVAISLVTCIIYINIYII